MQLVLQAQVFGAIVQNSGVAGQLRVGAPEFGQLDCLLLHPHHVGHPLVADHGIGAGPQLGQFQAL